MHHGLRTPQSVRTTAAPIGQEPTAAAVASNGAGPCRGPTGQSDHCGAGDSSLGAGDELDGEAEPLIVREKLHRADPMTLDQALFEMELVGHDFYLFCDKETELPSVVYRRHGYDYGVIRLETTR